MTRSIGFGCLSGPGEGRGSYELGEIEVSFRDTQFLETGWIVQEVY